MKFTCHPVGTKQAPVAWCIVGEGKFFKGSFIEPLKDHVLMMHHYAEFEKSFAILWGEETILRQGVDAYLKSRPRR